MRQLVTFFIVSIPLALALDFRGIQAQAPSPLPNRPDSLKIAVIGDNGTGATPQYDVARQMALSRESFRFALVLMVGDSFYGGQRPADREKKFAEPYRPLLDAGVVFRAALGNHDEPATVDYAPMGMYGSRYYTFTIANVRIVVLDTNFLDAKQLQWAEETLAAATEEWTICVFHHPLYSDAGRHGSNIELRVMLEPLLVKYGVHVVFAGHDHIYERLKPQQGIQHFVVGSGGQLRKGDLQPSATTATGFDQDQAFLLVEIDGPELFFQAISRTGVTVDSGHIRRATVTDGPVQKVRTQ